MAFDTRIPYALVDAEGRIQSQNYALESELGAVEVAPGLYLHRAELPDGRPSILNPDRSYISEPGSPDAVWLQYARAALPFPAQVMTDDAGVVVMAAPAGTRVTTQDGVTHEEAGGEIAIIFPQGGRQIVKIEQPGCSLSSVAIIVQFLPATKALLTAEIDAARNAILYSPIVVDGIELDGDLEGQGNIAGAATMALRATVRGEEFETSFVLADNTRGIVTGAQLDAAVDIIAVRKSVEYGRARDAKNAVLAASDVATAEAARDAYLAGA